jgi:hypothetical protein
MCSRLSPQASDPDRAARPTADSRTYSKLAPTSSFPSPQKQLHTSLPTSSFNSLQALPDRKVIINKVVHMSMASLAVRNGPQFVSDWLRSSSRSPFESAKTILFFYVVSTQSLKLYRHLRARGVRQSIAEGWFWVSKVRLPIPMPVFSSYRPSRYQY